MIETKNVVAVISLTEWLVKGRRHFGIQQLLQAIDHEWQGAGEDDA